MIITKKSLARRTFLRGMGATVALPLLDAMVPSMTALAQTPAKSRPASRIRVHPDGVRHRELDAFRRQRRADHFVAIAESAGAVYETPDGAQQHGAQERVSRNARDVERCLSERRQGEVDREQRLLPGHDGRSDRSHADGAGDAASLARARHGPDGSRGAVRQRVCVRLPEQPVVVVADDTAAFRGTSARRVRAAVR